LEVNELMSWLTMRATVTVFHNVCRDGEPMLTGYRPSDVLVPVATWTVRRWRDPEEVAEDAFRLLNVGEDPVFGKPDPVAVEYRQRGNRSLSVGDCGPRRQPLARGGALLVHRGGLADRVLPGSLLAGQ
jgi:hypothetical protein